MTKYIFAMLLTLGMSISLHAQRVNNLFTAKASFSKSLSNIVSDAQALTLNSAELTELESTAPASFTLEVPFRQGTLALELKKAKITTSNFSVIEGLPGGGRRNVKVDEGVYYQGKVVGQSSSVATISISGGKVMGVIADAGGNIVLGPIDEKGTDEYTLYRESALKVKNPSSCFASEEMIGELPAASAGTARGNQTGEPIEIYFECDYAMYLEQGSNTTQVIRFVLGFFNSVAQLYDVEDIKVQVSQIFVWTTQDPEAAANLNTTSAVLPAFANRMISSNYIGDYAHFLSRRNLGGGIAYVLGNPCGAPRANRTAVSAINPTYQSFPTYSWTVQVVTHELGHNFGSQHTQWCGWVGGALDNCYPTENFPTGVTCPPGPQPTNGGTIMSYCHLTGTGINFSNGFGTQPGNRIRDVIAASSCFSTCKMVVNINSFAAACNLNNGSATVTATGNQGALSYLWSNGQTGATLTNVAPGTYYVTVTDAFGCPVMKDVRILNSGSTLTLDLTPGTTSGFCPGGNITLTATANPLYVYEWSRNGAVIAGATSSTYQATQPGTYTVRVTYSGCSATKSVEITQVAAPSAATTVTGATSFCEGGTVTLSSNNDPAYGYQWFRNGVAIAGANSQTYAAGQTGNYTVQVSAGNTCNVTSAATTVTVTPQPLVNLAAAGSTTICQGATVVLSTTANAGYTYSWTRNGVVIAGANTATYTASTSGAYRVTANSGACSRTSDAVNVLVNPNPVVIANQPTVTIEKFAFATLTFSGAETYNFRDQPDYVNSFANTLIVSPPSTKTYTIIGTDLNGCKDDAVATVVVIGCGPATDITSTVLSPSRVLVRWTNPVGVTSDSVQYRKAGQTTWTKVFATGTEVELSGLEPGANYEFNVIPLCTTTTSFLPSANQTITTPGLPNGLFIQLFPNPVTSTSRLEVISSTPYTLQVSIYDFSGKLLSQPVPAGNFNAGQVIRTIDGSRMAAGIYHIAVRINGKLQNIKMMVVH